MISLITPTSDRPQAFAICEKLIAKQTYKGPLEWIVADDGFRPVQCAMGQIHIRRQPASDPAQSFRGNLRAALERATGEIVLIIEDDDWRSPDYISFMAERLQAVALFGEGNARYYNAQSRRWTLCGNRKHASLGQTGFKRQLLPFVLEQVSLEQKAFVDLRLWKTAPEFWPVQVDPESLHSVGIKGLPGKRGIGIGHRLDDRYRHDPELRQLQQWIGEEAEQYREFAN